MGAGPAVEAGLLKGKSAAIDATTLEANAAMRSIVRRDTGERYQEFLVGLAKASGITSNKAWTHPGDPDAKVTKMKDGRTHLAHKAEHAVDLDTGANCRRDAAGCGRRRYQDDRRNGDCRGRADRKRAGRRSRTAVVGRAHRRQGVPLQSTLVDFDAVGIRSYIAEPDRGPRDWSEAPEAQAPCMAIDAGFLDDADGV